jgi:hypothetical protein
MREFLQDLKWLRQVQLKRGYKRGWIYHQLRQKFDLGLIELELIAAFLGYHPGWVEYEWEKLQHKSGSYEPQSQQRESIPRRLKQPLLLLGLEFPFTKEQLVSAYRRMTLSNHPDGGGDAKSFISIHEAYQTLKGYLALAEGGAL